VPRIYAWNSELNSVGAEYMIMEKVSDRCLVYLKIDSRKVRGRSADSVWDSLSLLDKKKIVTQVAQYLLAMFQLRFNQAGSLYLSPSANPYYVGPIIATKFFQIENGLPVYSDPRVTDGLQRFRGPFSHAADWLSHTLRAEMFVLESTDNHTFDVNTAMANMDAAVRLCSVYPGEKPVVRNMKSPQMPFSFRFDDISLNNFMVCLFVLGDCMQLN
jgi:hypothetical protein